MKQVYDAEMEDGEVLTIHVDQRDIRKWESTWDLSWLAAPVSYTQIAQLVYLSGTRSGNAFKSRFPAYEDFDKVCVFIRAVDDKEEPELVANPTQSEATDAFSAL
jgi:hypothetical protein